MAMLSIGDWNRQQLLVFRRYSRLNRVPLTLEVLVLLAQRFARKHADQRKYADAGRTPAPRVYRGRVCSIDVASQPRPETPTLAGTQSHISASNMALPDELPPLFRLSGPPHSSPAGAAYAPVTPMLPLCSDREGHPRYPVQDTPVPRPGPAALAATAPE